MSTPQEDVGNAIASLLEQPPFTDHIDGAGYGFTPSERGRGALGTALVMARDAETVNAYDDSMQIRYSYSVEVRYSNRSPSTPYTDLQRAMRNIFNPASKSLQGAFTNTSGKVLGTVLRADFDLIDADIDTNGQTRGYTFDVTATLWETTP